MKVFFNVTRDAYDYEDGCIGETMTLGELIERLQDIAEECGEDAKVFTSHDNGYTYGTITEQKITYKFD